MRLNWPQSFRFIGKAHPDGLLTRPGTIYAYARAISRELEAREIGPGDRVALWLSQGADQVAAILGCWMVGAAFSVIPSYPSRSSSEHVNERTGNVLTVLDPKAIIQSETKPLPEPPAGDVHVITLTGPDLSADADLAEGADIPTGGPDDLAFIQFTSGSTGGTAKGAEVRFRQLDANLSALTTRMNISPEDRMVTWAPLYHDMGLIAVLLALRSGADLVLLETDTFVRRPSSWLEAISQFQGTVTTGPPTGLKLLSRRRAKDVDLSSLRYAWIGGEAVFPSVLREFEDCYAEAGLKPGVMQPTYGMAETVVGISCGDPGVPPTVKEGFISCGRPLDDMDLQVVDEDGAPVSDGSEGRILVRSASVISGYLGLPRFEDGGWFDTGDLGFVSDGLVFITGRLKDVIKRGSESFPAVMVEAVAEEALELGVGRAAAFANFSPEMGKEEVVLLVEARGLDDGGARQVAASVLDKLGLQIDVIRTPKAGRLPRTSSGKLMRRLAAAQYREGKI